MRILHIQKATGIGGSERHLLSLLPALTALGHEIECCVLTAGDSCSFTEELSSAGVRWSGVRAGRRMNPALTVHIARVIRRFRPEIVHTHLIHADIYGQLAAVLTRAPRVSTLHSTARQHSTEPYRTAVATLNRSASAIIAISHHVERFVGEFRLAPLERVQTIHYGIDADSWTATPAERADARRALQLAPHAIACLAASRLVPNKGHEAALDAFLRALQHRPELVLIIAGDGPLRADLELRARHAAPAESVRFLGFVPDLRLSMAASDVVLFPTVPGFGEGFGLVNLEAMAAAKPVVATRIDSIPEIVIHDETGLLVEPGDIDGLAAAILRLAANENLRRTLGRNGRTRAGVVFSLDAMVTRTAAVYERTSVGGNG